MSKIRSRHTRPELLLRKALRGAGLQYRLHYGKRRIDIAFPKEHVAVFVDGCFWHKCPKCYKEPKSNKKYWLPKIKRNVQKAGIINRELEKNGWLVIRVWEHSINKNVAEVASRIRKKMQKRPF